LRAALSVNRENEQTIHGILNSFKLSSISPPSVPLSYLLDPHGQFITFLYPAARVLASVLSPNPRLERIAIACTVWGDLFNRPVCGFVRLGNKRE
jgi:hypothetical protein